MARFLLITYALEQTLMKLGLLDFEEIDPRYGLDRSVKALKEVLPSVQALLQDTEEMVVVSLLSGALYFLQDRVDSIEYSLDRLAIPGKLPNLYLERMLDVLNTISHTLKEIRSNKQQVESSGLGVISDDVKIVGRGDDVLKIVEILMGLTNHQLLHVFPIVGMAGLGKTALARLVCEAVSEGQLFDETVWISVSDNFENLTVLREMLKALGEHMAGGADSKGETLEHLSKELQGKRFLLVLDDVWNEDVEKWDGLKDCLLKVGGSNGSAVLVTTRSGQAASIMETFPGSRHDLKRLSDGDCWSIISEKVSGNEGEPLPPDLEVIGKEIASKCGGVPLVAHFLGETMCSGKERGQWLSVKNSCLRDIPGYEDIIIPTLQKSFYHLPSPALKLCFAYCSIFSQDFTVEKDRLIQLWMAEGFLVQSNDQRMEDTGEVFFNKFVDSSFVEVVEWDERGNIRSCKMNRLMHDLAFHVSKFRTLNSETCSDLDGACRIHHANLICDVELALVYRKIAATGLVSLFTHAADVLHWSLNFEYMRTLNLDGADIKELIDSIGNLERLRFLDLSRTCIKALPESITKLHNMQTLRLIECASLQSLPRNMRGLRSLRHIYFTYHHQMPVKVGCLTSLQTLPIFVVGKDSDSTIQELESLNGLRGQLSIYNLQEVKNKKEAEKANLRGKTKIYKLEFVWSSGRKCFKNDEEVLEALQPHSNLETLKIEHYGGGKLPSWLLMKSPTHGGSLLVNCLVNLKLIDCKRCKLPMLGHLPRLESLEIDGLDKVRNGFSERMAVFPALKKLSLRRMVNLVQWMVPAVREGHSVVFPFLEELSIMSCPLLASISLNAPSLAQLEICFCEELKSLSMDSSASTALDDLTIKCCPNLESIPSAECLKSLKSLEIDGLDKVRTIDMKFHRSTGFSETMAVFPALKKLSLHRMVNLVEWMLPAVREGHSAVFPFLEELSIISCPLLASISLHAPSLAQLEICFCDELKSLSMDSSASTALEDLTIKCCPNLESIPSAECLRSLKSLEIDGLDKVRTGFSETMAVFPAFKKLSLHRMVNLDEWMVPAVREDHSAVFPFLEELSIISCTLLASISAECQNEGCHKSNSPLTTSLQIFNSLQYLRLEDFPGLFSIPDLQNLSLKGLTIKHCPDLECIDSLQNLTTLEDLRIEVCPYLKSIPSVGDLSSLKTLSIQRCHKLTSLPTEIQSCLSLENLSIQWCIELTSIPDELKELHSLVQLEITKCPSLTYFPEDNLYSLTQLKQLTIGPFSEQLEAFPGLNSIQPFHPPLEELQIHGWNRLKSLPDQLQQLTVLKSLDIGRFNKVEALPEWLGDLTSLQQLRIWRCENLRSLPTSMQRLKLKRLEIIDCHTLKKTCAEGSGPEDQYALITGCSNCDAR